jgi:hypothetical protein
VSGDIGFPGCGDLLAEESANAGAIGEKDAAEAER